MSRTTQRHNNLLREHFRYTGQAKKWFSTRAEAEEFRDRRCPAKQIYPCMFGTIRHWHIGGKRKP